MYIINSQTKRLKNTLLKDWKQTKQNKKQKNQPYSKSGIHRLTKNSGTEKTNFHM